MHTKGGRPTKYTDDLPQRVREYADSDPFASVAGLCVELDIVKDTVYRWAKDPSKKPFSDALQYLKHKQERDLQKHGLEKVWDSGFAKFLLSANFGYREKSDVTSKDEKMESAGIFISKDFKEDDG